LGSLPESAALVEKVGTMELRHYLRILLRNWWIVILLTALAVAATLIFSSTSTPTYEATSTYVVVLQPLDSIGNTLYGLDTLTSKQQRMFTSYCRLLDSRAVFAEAIKIINVNSDAFNPAAYTATCTVLPETNVLRVAVHGPKSAIVQRINEAISIIGIARANELYKYFLIEPLNPVRLNEIPILPNYAQNAVLGAIFGLIMGVMLVFVREYLFALIPSISTSRNQATNAPGTFERFGQYQRKEEAISHGKELAAVLVEVQSK
jgi:polysaccharide biosynthesis transport protein